MTTDVALVLTAASAFALLATTQVAILAGLLRRNRSRPLIWALLVPPLAPYFSFTEGMRVRGWLWLGCGLLYGLALVLTVRAS